MKICLLRHGTAAPLGPENNYRDEERALTPEGAIKMRKAAQGLKRLGLTLDLIASSPLLRAQQTAEIVADVLKFREPLRLWDDLAPEAPVEGALQKLEEFRDRETVLLTGHQPHIGCLAAHLIFGTSKVSLSFKKGALFSVLVSEVPPRAPGELQWVLSSKMMRQIAELK